MGFVSGSAQLCVQVLDLGHGTPYARRRPLRRRRLLLLMCHL
ncbi:hypothetical protein [Streptomyces yunnanensis]|nr:hypothetical protein [Streptomyces yunnanensis]